jgi:hypothetical protein
MFPFASVTFMPTQTDRNLLDCNVPTGASLQLASLSSWRARGAIPFGAPLCTKGIHFKVKGMSNQLFDASGPPPQVKTAGHSMGVAAGRKIKQGVYPDMKPAALFDDENAERLWIHTVSSEDWEVSSTV